MSKNLQKLLAEREIYSVTTDVRIMTFMMLIVSLAFLVLAITLPDPPPNPVTRLFLRLLLLFFAVMTFIFTPRYKISFREDGVLITVGYFNVIKIRLDRNKITYVGLAEWNPLRDFGGSGIKTGFGKYKNYWCFNALGGKGIEIRTTEKNYLIEVGELERHRLISMIGDYPRGKK